MKPLDEVLKESPESRFNLLMKILMAHWVITIIGLIVITIVIIEEENILFYLYGTSLGISILMILYDIFDSLMTYYDGRAWYEPNKGVWVILVLIFGPIALTFYYYSPEIFLIQLKTCLLHFYIFYVHFLCF